MGRKAREPDTSASERPPDDATRDSEVQEDIRQFFESDDETWLDDLREAETPQALGTLGPYELLEEVSRGGQGIVYRALQGRRKRPVAVKRLIAGALATEPMRRRFYREVEAASALDHPNIVNVHGMRVIDDQPVLAMQWIEGVPIVEWANASDGAKRSLLVILNVFVKVCDAVHHAHQRGVIHRDLKPSNILVDAGDEPKVLDFGLAKTADPEGGAMATLTLTAQFLGTPAYAAPEQFESGPDRVDVRSDAYSLGVILYEMLTERLPYKIEGSITDVVSAINTVEPSRPSAISNRADREIDAIVLKSLAKRPEERYQSVEAFAADIRRYLNGEPVLAHPPSSFYQLGKILRRHKVAVAFVATVVLLIVGIATVAVTLTARLDVQKEKVRLAEQGEKKARRMANQVNNFVKGVLDESSPLRHGGSIGHFDVLRQASDWASFSLLSEPSIEARVRLTIAEYYGRVWMWPEAEPNINRALTIYNRFPPDDAEILCTAKLMHAIVLQDAGSGAAIQAFREAEAIAFDIRYDWLTDENNPWVSRAIMGQALSLIQTGGPGRAEEALGLAEVAIERCEETTAANDLLLGAAYHTSGSILAAMNRPQDAEVRLRQALRLFGRSAGTGRVYGILGLADLAEVLEGMGRSDEARAARLDTVDRIRREFGEGWTAYALWRVARQMDLTGRDDAAERYMHASLAWLCREIGDSRPELRAPLSIITGTSVADSPPFLPPNLCRSVGDILGEARPALDASLARQAGRLLAAAASILERRDGPQAAEPVYRKAVALLGDIELATELTTIESYLMAANCFKTLEDYERAEPLLKTCSRKFQDALGRTHRRTDAARQSLADLYRLMGRLDLADEVARDGPDGSSPVAH